MRRNAALLFVVVLLTRLPFLGPGFGSDADAWRIAGAARTIAQTGHYVASRFPGAPVVELSDSLLLRLGPWALPLASAIWGAIACVAFYVTLCRLGVRGCFWAALALAFTPVFWIHTTDAMDYSWALGLALVSLALAVHARPTLAGVALGLAIGCRLPTALLIVPIAVLLEGRNYPRFVLATILFGALALAPSFLTYGTRFLSGYEFGRVPWIYVVKGATRDVWGVIGTIAIALGAVLAMFRLHLVPRHERLAILSAIAFTAAIYLRLPHDGAYLLPMVPFVLLFMARTLDKSLAVVLASLLLVSSLLVNISQANGFFLQAKGPLLVERDRRVELLRTRDLVLERSKHVPSDAVVMVYELLPTIAWSAPSTPKFVHLLTPASMDLARERDTPMFATEEAWDNEWKVFRVRPKDFGVQLLSDSP